MDSVGKTMKDKYIYIEIKFIKDLLSLISTDLTQVKLLLN